MTDKCDCACVCPFPPDMVCEPRHLYKNPFVTWGTHKAASTTSIDVGTIGVMGQSVCGLTCDHYDSEGGRVELWNLHSLKALCLNLPMEMTAHQAVKSFSDSSLSYSKTTVCVCFCIHAHVYEYSRVTIYVINWN